MTPKNPIALLIVGAAAATGALVASPGTYAWLRRTLKLEDDRAHYEDASDTESSGAPPPSASDTSLADARLTLRARLQESGAVSPSETPEASPTPAPDAASEARERLRAKVEEAKAALLDEDRTDEIEPVA